MTDFHSSTYCRANSPRCRECRLRSPLGEKVRANIARRFTGFDPAAPCPKGMQWIELPMAAEPTRAAAPCSPCEQRRREREAAAAAVEDCDCGG